MGGSPNSRDTCSLFRPPALIFNNSGQSHLYGTIVVNIRLNYLPQDLLKSATDCKDSCSDILDVSIVSGFSSSTSIKATYLPGSTYSFSVEIKFGK